MDIWRRVMTYWQGDTMLKRIIRNSSMLMSANVVVSLIVLVQAAVVTRALGAEGFGLLTLVTTFVLTVDQLLDSRVWEAVIRYVTRYHEQGDVTRASAALKLFYLIDAVGAVIKLVVVALLADWAAVTVVGSNAAADLIRFYAMLVIIDFSTETASALLRVGNRYRWIATHSITVAAIRLLAALVMVAVSPTVEFMLVMMLLTSLISVLILQTLAWRVRVSMGLNFKAPVMLLRDEFRPIAGFIMASNLSDTNQLIAQRVDILILGWLTNPTIVGHYELGKRLVRQLSSVVTSAVRVTVYPEIARAIARKEYLQVIKLQRSMTLAALGITLPACVVGVVVAPWVIPLIFGAEFGPSVPVFQIMIWFLVWISVVWFNGYMLSIGRIRSYVILTTLITMAYVGLLVLLIPIWGANGAALASTLRIVLTIAGSLLMARQINQRILDGRFVPV